METDPMTDQEGQPEFVTPDEIRERAHQLWEASGQSWGRDEEFWIEAEDQLLREKCSADRNADGTNSFSGAIPKSDEGPASIP
jgi:hypothetical protein